MQILARKSAKLFANTKEEIFGKEWCKIHRQLQRFGKERWKSAKLFANTKEEIFGKERWKIHRQVQRYKRDVTSVSLSLSLSVSVSLFHRMHLTHNIGSASALPIIIDSQRWRSRAQSHNFVLRAKGN